MFNQTLVIAKKFTLYIELPLYILNAIYIYSMFNLLVILSFVGCAFVFVVFGLYLKLENSLQYIKYLTG